MSIYTCIFLIAFSTLALEITLTRLLSVVTWYHLAFFAIATAMLGMTAGATTVYLRPRSFADERLNSSIAKACIAYAVAIPATLLTLCLTRLDITESRSVVFALLLITAVCAVPFYFSGIATTAILTRQRRPIGKLYASDLVGAAMGCLFVLAGLEILDAPSLILLCSVAGSLAALTLLLSMPPNRLRRVTYIVLILTVGLVLFNSISPRRIRPYFVKGKPDFSTSYFIDRWNSFSRVVVHPLSEKPPQYWGPSPRAPREPIAQYEMTIDGDAATTVRRFANMKDLEHLRYDVTNLAYYLRGEGGAFLIGIGGARDVQSAIVFGHKKIIGVDVNPVFIDLLTKDFREFAGVADREGVKLTADEGRAYLSRNKDSYAVIQMTLIDTWAATAAGAFSLSEHGLYTIDAWRIAFKHLAPNGIFTVSRWYNPNNLGEAGRLVSLAVATLLDAGVTEPAKHIALVTRQPIATLLLSKQPFSDQDVDTLRHVVTEMKFNPAIIPGLPPKNRTLRAIAQVRSRSELASVIENEPLNYTPPTDENPYFFNMLRLNNIRLLSRTQAGVRQGNLFATFILMALIGCLLLVAIATIIVPLLIKQRGIPRSQREWVSWSGAGYFALIGAGFMFLEMALIQRLSVFLSHPAYAFGILLFTLILSAGLGSLASEKIPVTRSKWPLLLPICVAGAALITRFLLPEIFSILVAASMRDKILVSIASIFPTGMLMGVFFPIGMRLVSDARREQTPWYWAINGIFSVLSSAVAVFVSIYFGISKSFYVGAICYALLIPCIYFMRRADRNTGPPPANLSQMKDSY
jgi:hypothetical protein